MLKLLGRYVHQSWLVVFVCVGIILGVLVGLVLKINYFVSPIWIFLVGILLVFAYLQPKLVFVIIALIAGMVLAFLRVATELSGENYVRQFYNVVIKVEGTIVGDPETNEDITNLKLADLKFGEMERELEGKLYISVARNAQLLRGDRIMVEGRLSEGFGTYVGYLYKPVLLRWERPEPGDLILKVRNWFALRIKKLIPEPEVNLGMSYLMGMKADLAEDLEQSLRMVGLVHIVVASGAHLAILVEFVRKILGKLSRFAGLLFSILFILMFMSMVGWTASILRAGIMAILALLAWYGGRKFAPWRIILLVAALTLMINPILMIDLGWLLSFASYTGIMMLGPKLKQFFYGEKELGLVANTIITTAAATLMTLPITLYYYGTISLVSMLANLLILPTLPYAMGLVFLTGVVAGIPAIEIVTAFLTTKLLDLHMIVVEFFGGMREFLIEIPTYNKLVFLIYGLISLPFLIKWLKRLWYNKKYEQLNT